MVKVSIVTLVKGNAATSTCVNFVVMTSYLHTVSNLAGLGFELQTYHT